MILILAINSQVRNDNVQKVVKIWNFAKDRGHENFQFLTKFWLNLKLSEIVKMNKKNTLEYYFDTCNSLKSQKCNVQKVVKIWNFSKDRGHQNFQFLTKFWLNLKLLEIVKMNKKKHLRILFWHLQFTQNSEMAMFKKWSKSEISLRTAVMKVFNFWQNFDSTSNFHKWFKTTKRQFRISFWHLQLTHKSEITMFKKWSKFEISLRSAVMKMFNF